jgi:hypothetical protein
LLILAELWYGRQVGKERFQREILRLLERLEPFEDAARD